MQFLWKHLEAHSLFEGYSAALVFKLVKYRGGFGMQCSATIQLLVRLEPLLSFP